MSIKPNSLINNVSIFAPASTTSSAEISRVLSGGSASPSPSTVSPQSSLAAATTVPGCGTKGCGCTRSQGTQSQDTTQRSRDLVSKQDSPGSGALPPAPPPEFSPINR